MGTSIASRNWKKRSETAILGLCAALITAGLFSGFGRSEQQSVQELLMRRSDIIQWVWYSELTPEQGEEMLKEIETHPLLGEDVAWLRKAEEGMGFAYVLDMEILEWNRTSRSCSGTCYTAEIRWQLEEYNQHVTEEYSYRIRTAEKNDGTVLLSEFEAL